ncbi:histone-lysine N-methyltransferase SETMAR [Trichonephila clavipes]|nr:histone-lysine N-methyltransferase SETMAR [Trichonephila clavipes]
MAWPAYSPDLNPIENLWDALGRAVSSRFPPPVILNELETALQEEWRLLNSAVVDHLIESMLITRNFEFVDSVQAFLMLKLPLAQARVNEVDRHVSSRSITQELKIDHKTGLSLLSKVGFKKKLDVWLPHQLTPKNVMNLISICKALAERNEINPFLKRMVTGDEKWVTYDNIG